MIRRSTNNNMVTKDGPRANEEITSAKIQLIDQEGVNHGVVELKNALIMAAQDGLDLIEIAPNASPPVCKIGDLGKLKYQTQKKASLARKKQKIIEIKEIKLRPNIDIHDYNIKKKAVIKFLDNGDKVKITLRFRGRELAHQELGVQLIERMVNEIGDKYKVESAPKLEGRQIIAIMAPK